MELQPEINLTPEKEEDRRKINTALRVVCKIAKRIIKEKKKSKAS